MAAPALAAVALTATLAGCSAADTASHQASVAADNFETVRELTVFDNVTGDILFVARGRMSINVDVDESQLEMVIAQPDGTYEKHFAGLNETTTYIVRDLDGVDVDSFRYQVVVNPDMLVPFEFKLADGGDGK